jgi:hypothetical protein
LAVLANTRFSRESAISFAEGDALIRLDTVAHPCVAGATESISGFLENPTQPAILAEAW